MKQAVIFGAGDVGRGFVGQLFSESGYAITFIDVDLLLINSFNQEGQYTIRLVTNHASSEVRVGPVRGALVSDQAAVIRAITEADIGATAVGANVLPHVALMLAAGITQRAKREITSPLNILICENLKQAASKLREMVQTHLAVPYHAYISEYVGFIDTVIARMVPPLTPEMQARDPTLIVAEPYRELPADATGFVGPPPQIVGMKPDSPFDIYSERKRYIHEAGQAILGYIGFAQGYEFGHEALENAAILAVVRGAMLESAQALERKHSLAAGALSPFVEDLLTRFGNRALGDRVVRLGRDPLRKLSHDDRLIGAALLALSQGVEPENLVKGVVAALQFNPREDSHAQRLQAQLRDSGLKSVLRQVCLLDPDSPLGQRIRAAFEG